MFGVVLGGDAFVVAVDVEVNATAAGAAADFDARQGARGLLDPLQVLVRHADAFGVAGQGVEVITEMPGATSLPIPARHADPLGIEIEGIADPVVFPGRVRGRVLRDADAVPGVAAVGPGGLPPGNRLAVADDHVHLRFHRNRPPIHEIGVGRRFPGMEEVVEGFGSEGHGCYLMGAGASIRVLPASAAG